MVVRPLRWYTFNILLTALGVATRSGATLTNRTIDDLDGDSVTGAVPQYVPADGGWNQGSLCPGCFVQLDRNQLFHGTWSDATVPRDATDPWSITMHFTGTAIYVYNALANNVPSARTDQNMKFVLDGQQAGSFAHAATSSTDKEYRVLVFSQTGLKNSAHTLVIQPQPDSNILFDYAMYTFDDGQDEGPTSVAPPPPPPPSTTTTSHTTTTTPTTTTSSSSSPSIDPLRSSSPTDTTLSSTSSTGTPLITSPGADSSTTPLPSVLSDASTSSSDSSPTAAALNATTSKSTPVGAIVGAVVGVLLLIAAAVALLLFLRRRRRRFDALAVGSHPRNTDIDPFSVEPKPTGHVPRMPPAPMGMSKGRNTAPPSAASPSEVGSSAGLLPSPSESGSRYDVPNSAAASILAMSQYSASSHSSPLGTPPIPPPSGLPVSMSMSEKGRDSPAPLAPTPPPAPAPAHAPGAVASNTTLQTELAALRAEVVRLQREQANVHSLLTEAPPQYPGEAD